jgi:hypothetical protein
MRHLFTSSSGSIATLLRIRYIKQLDATSDFLCTSASHQLPLFLTKPVHIANVAIWSSVEPGIGIIAGSLATYRPLFRRIFSETGSLRFGTRRTALAARPNHFGYNRTSSVRDEAPPESNPPFSILTTNGAPSSKKAKRWYGENERYEMDENLGRAKRFTQTTSSETHGV